MDNANKQFNALKEASFQNKPLEANLVFPSDPKSAYISSRFADSFRFPFNPDDLATGNNYDTYDEMRHDDQVKSALATKKNIVLAPGWQIKCEDEKIVEFYERNFTEKLEENFEDGLFDMLSSFDYGFSLTEPIYRKPKGGLIELKELKTRPPHTFEFNLNAKGDLETITQNQSDGVQEFKKSFFLHQIYQPEFGNPFGQSDLRAAFLPWKTKKFTFRFWAIYLERFASPTIIGKYDGDETDLNKINEFQAVIKRIQNSTAISIPDSMEIEFKETMRDSSDTYIKSINSQNTMIARAILMPDLMGMSGGQTQQGSRSLGETQFDMFLSMIRREQRALARNITIKIIRPMTLANFGDIPCSFEFKPFSKDDAMELMKIWVDAVKGKVWKPNEEEVNHLREQLKFPAGPVELPEAPENPIDPARLPPGKPKKGVDDPEDDDKDNEGARLKDKGDTRIYRDLSEFEKKIDFNRIKAMLDTAEKRVFGRLRSEGRDIYLDFINQIKRKNLLGRFNPEGMNQLTPRFQKPMNLEFKRYLTNLYVDSFNEAQKEMFPDRKEIKHFVNTKELLPAEFIEVIEAESFKLVGDYSVNITGKVRNLLTEGIKAGFGERELVRQMKALAAEETDKWLKVVVRTKTNEMFNRARKSFYDNDPEASQIVEAFEFSAILDSRTSEVCTALDGKIFDKNSDIINSVLPPLHFACRSILVPVTKFESFKDKKITKFEPGQTGFVTKSKEPSVDTLKKLGGNLILIDKQKTKEFFHQDQDIFTSGVVVAFGANEVIPSPGPDKSILILAVDISNSSDLHNAVVGVHADIEDEVRHRRTLTPGDFMLLDFHPKGWFLGTDSGFVINMTSENTPLDFTVQYQIVDKDGKRVL